MEGGPLDRLIDDGMKRLNELAAKNLADFETRMRAKVQKYAWIAGAVAAGVFVLGFAAGLGIGLLF